MADVSRRSGDGQGRTDRGQLILVTGLLVAVTMVAIVLLLNTAIFTENLASRGVDQSGREALEYRGVLVDEVTRLVEAENEREWGSWATLHDTTRDGVLRVDNYTARTYATRGAVAGVNHSTLTVHEGKLVRQNVSSRELTGASGADNWDVARSVEGTRRFTMTVTASSLNTTTASDAQAEDSFRVLVDGGAWTAFVYTDQATGNITLATKVGAGSTSEHCSVSATEATVNLSAGTMDGTSCGGYSWAEGASAPYDVRFEHGLNATGTYNLTVDATGSTTYPDLNPGGPPSPFHVPVVYAVTFDVYYETPTLAYRAPVRVDPGESA